MNAFSSKWSKKPEEMAMETQTPTHQRYMTLDDSQKVGTFMNVPTGQSHVRHCL
ncbi:MAG: hypothetical protein RR471_03500 [Bacteroides sp.]